MIPIFIPEFTEEMEFAALDSLRNEKYILGESVYKFEEEFAKFIGTKYAISVNSGGSALQLSLLSLGISNGSSVITSTNSFIASANCILAVGAKPVLCDIHQEDGNIDIKSNKQQIDGIIPVHIYGNPCDYNSIRAVSEEQKIPVIEDACQAHGAVYCNKKTGNLGNIGCFSFYPTKNMTVCGDGGMVTTNNEEIAQTIVSLRDNGRKTRTEHDKLGFTMRLNTVSAAIGRIQLKHLHEKNQRRQEIAKLYRKNLTEDCILQENPKGTSVYHQIVIRHEKRDDIMKHLSDNNIGTAIHYPIPIHKQPIYLKYGFELPNSEQFSKEVLSLPSSPLLTDENIREVCEKINKIIS